MNSDWTQAPDERLLERYRSGDRTAFDELFRRYRSMVIGICRRELGDQELAEDAASAVFLVLYDKARSLRPTRSISSWLFSVSMLCIKNARRTEKRTMTLHSKLSHHPDKNSTDDDLANPDLSQALMRLKEPERQVITLYYLEEMTVSEISLRLGIKEGACRMRLRRGMDSLRRRLGAEGFAALPTAFGARSLAMTASYQAPSAAATSLAARLTHALAIQAAIRAATVAVFAVSLGSVGVGIVHATLSHGAGAPKAPAAKAQVVQAGPPDLPAVPRMPDGLVPPGTKFQVSFFVQGKLVGRRNTTIGQTGYALTTFDLGEWPGVQRGSPDPKKIDGVSTADIESMGAGRNQGVLKFSIQYLPAPTGKRRSIQFKGAFLGADSLATQFSMEESISLRYTDITMIVGPAGGADVSLSSIGPEWRQRQGGPWVLVSGDEKDREMGQQFVQMEKSLPNKGSGDLLGIAIRELPGVRP